MFKGMGYVLLFAALRICKIKIGIIEFTGLWCLTNAIIDSVKYSRLKNDWQYALSTTGMIRSTIPSTEKYIYKYEVEYYHEGEQRSGRLVQKFDLSQSAHYPAVEIKYHPDYSDIISVEEFEKSRKTMVGNWIGFAVCAAIWLIVFLIAASALG